MGSLQRRRDGMRVFLSAEHVVGRLPLSHLPLPASFVSTAHALLRWNGRGWEIRDLGSRNGTFVAGERIAVGASVPLEPDAEIAFGEASETWRVTDDGPPAPAVIAVGSGETSVLVSGAIPVPSAEAPLATIYPEGEGWTLELDDVRTPLAPGQTFLVAGKEWRFVCPTGAVPTQPTEAQWKRLVEVDLIFTVSRNEEHVSLAVRHGPTVQDLGERACFYLAMVLVERRLAERRQGQSEPGWLEVPELLKMVPDYTSISHVNVQICRLRQLLHDAGIVDSARIIERRRGQLRFGTDRAEIARLRQPRGEG